MVFGKLRGLIGSMAQGKLCTNEFDNPRDSCMNEGRLMKTQPCLGKVGKVVAASTVALGTLGAADAAKGAMIVDASGITQSGNITSTFQATFSDALADWNDSSSVGYYYDPAGQITMTSSSGLQQTWTGLEIYIEDSVYDAGFNRTIDHIAIQSTAPGASGWLQFWTPDTWFSSDSLQNLEKINNILSLTNNYGWNNYNYLSQMGGLGLPSTTNTTDAIATIPEPKTAGLLGLGAIAGVGLLKRHVRRNEIAGI